MLKYLEYCRISFLTILAYRARYYVGIFTYLIYIAVYYSIWRAVYAGGANAEANLAGFNLSQMITYVAVGWIVRSFMFNNLDREIEQKVVDGSLSMDLLKPVDFQAMLYSRVFGEGMFRLLLFALPTALIAFPLFRVALPSGPIAAGLFVVSALLGAVVFTNVNFMVGALAIPLRNIEGISYAKQNLLLFLSGLLIPFDLLPNAVAAILKALPFAGMSYDPLRIYLGRCTSVEALQIVGIQSLWAAATLAASRGLWNLFMKKVVIQGG